MWGYFYIALLFMGFLVKNISTIKWRAISTYGLLFSTLPNSPSLDGKGKGEGERY